MRYQKKLWLLGTFAIAIAAGAGIIIGASIPASGGVKNPTLILPTMLVVGAVVLLAGWPWWQKTDDLQKQGQLISWWWGGTGGGLFLLIALVVLTGRHSDLSLGATYLLLAEFAGMAVAFLIWKLRGRGFSE